LRVGARATLSLMAELGDFLRSRRARLQPQDVGLPDYGRRRVPGLRREELAQLAGVSVDYYVRLEQGRDIQPSDSVLDAVATALRLDDAERAHLITLVRPRERARRRATERVRPHVRDLVARMDFPALVTGRRMDVLASNPIARALLGELREPNMARHAFLDEGARVLYVDWEQIAADTVAFLRLTAAEDPDDAQFVELIGELSLHSAQFRKLWAKHDVKAKTFGVKRYDHPQVGRLDLHWETLKLADPGQVLVTYTPADAASETALELLRTLCRDEDRGAVGDDDRVLEVRRR
jgi:transcriptional regulator with XRE-family HTH domain